ncbi:DUF2470 domain-containing protein [Paramicrobacterium sp. CJ85]|uniref:DUF2470 domain-containing protein n=1 Tax=Paramicrobacterium sp. CJ85 TaxID=3445355 RepID=UPI003F62D3F6
MTQHFDADVVNAVLSHMNSDHTADNVTIVRAYADASAAEVSMIGLDGDGGDWEYTDAEGQRVVTRIPWTREVLERKDVRRAIVEVFRNAEKRLADGAL